MSNDKPLSSNPPRSNFSIRLSKARRFDWIAPFREKPVNFFPSTEGRRCLCVGTVRAVTWAMRRDVSYSRRRTFPDRDQGMALVIVLALLVLVLAMAIAFLTSVTTERMASSNFVSSASTRILGDTAVSLVQAQITHASTEPDVGGNPVAWTSQPGMVRTFNQDGSLRRAYKLYSDSSMTVDTVNPTAIVGDLSSWATSPAAFTDLNSPIGVDRNGDGAITPEELVYPILNPAGISASGGVSPIIDGFSVSGAPGSTSEQPVPMPVRWLYVLKNGSLAAATGTGNSVTVSGASEDNPIVGRIAFWTDDESCKLNINTASHGLRWDIPRVMSAEETTSFALIQPVFREFQRFPGHPAMTSLAPVFGHLFGVDPQGSDPYATLEGPNGRAFSQFAYDMVPRIARGGSEFGTVHVSDITSGIQLDSDRLYASIDELLFDPNRNRQEPDGVPITLSTLETSRFFLTAHSRAPELNLAQRPRVSMWPINNGDNGKLPSSLDRLIAFCSTVNGIPFYFQRSEPDDPTSDISIPQNQQLRNYLRSLLALPFPSFGSVSFATKYGMQGRNQMVTQILDYIRASNLMPVDTYGGTPFPRDVTGDNFSVPENQTGPGRRGGQVSPIIDDDGQSMGFGRIPTISRAVLHFHVSDLIDRESGASQIPKRPMPASGSDTSPMVRVPRLNNSLLNASNPLANYLRVPPPTREYELETQAVLYFDFFDPMAGYPISDYNFDLIVEFQGPWTVSAGGTGGAQPLGFDSIQGNSVRIPLRYNGMHGYDFNLDGVPNNPRRSNTNYGYRLGGGRSIVAHMMGFLGFSRQFRDSVNNITGLSGADGLSDFYPLVSLPVRLHSTMRTVEDPEAAPGFRVKLEDAPNMNPNTPANVPPSLGSPAFQERFDFSGGRAIVKLVVNESGGADASEDRLIQTFELDFPAFRKPVPSYAPHTTAGSNSNVRSNAQFKQMVIDANFGYRIRGLQAQATHLGQTPPPPNPGDPEPAAAQSVTWLTQPGDIIVSLETAYGDPRLVAAKTSLTTDTGYSGGRANGDFVPHEDYFKGSGGEPVNDIRNRHAYSFRVSAENYFINVNAPYGPTSVLNYPEFGRFISGLDYERNALPNIPSRWRNGVPVFSLTGSSANYLPDFDTGLANMQDGPYINRADEGAVVTTSATAWPWSGASVVMQGEQESFYSPNKQMAGAGMLGSLPTGVISGNPWQTLLFRPDPTTAHPGSQDLPDYLIMDLFWMPVVEPYAISEPLSTAGKVNLNHQIFPFTYLNRDTALRGLLVTEEIPAVVDSTLGGSNPNGNVGYKRITAVNSLPASFQSRNRINMSATMQAINARFAGGNVYRSEAEFCTVPLIPIGQSYSPDFAYESAWWRARSATGDNMRERPYTNLIPRMTTRSNIYTVHYRVQSLVNPSGVSANTWDETRGQVVGEYRGSTTMERYINPNLNVGTWTTAATTPNLNEFYLWRVLNTKQFAP